MNLGAPALPNTPEGPPVWVGYDLGAAPMLRLHNAHVQKWCRWQRWLAGREGRWLGMAFWTAWHDDEVLAGGGYGSIE